MKLIVFATVLFAVVSPLGRVAPVLLVPLGVGATFIFLAIQFCSAWRSK